MSYTLDKAKQAKAKEIQKQVNEALEDFKRNFEPELKKMGLVAHFSLSGLDAEEGRPGNMIARFIDKDGNQVAIVRCLDIYEYVSLEFPRHRVYFPATIWRTIVRGSLPFTLVFKEIHMGLFKGFEGYFVPLDSLLSMTKEQEGQLLNDPVLRHPLTAALNADRNLAENILKKLYLSGELYLDVFRRLNITLSDPGNRCVIMPVGEETAIFLRTVEYEPNIERMLEFLSAIRGHVLPHVQIGSVVGTSPAPVFNALYFLALESGPTNLESK